MGTVVKGATGKKDIALFDPSTLVIVTDKAHPLFDERHALPVSESMVLNIMHHGVLEPIIVTRDTESDAMFVVAGRQRVKACIEANKRLSAQGLQTHDIQANVTKGTLIDSAGMMVSENEIREGDGHVVRAQKMQRLVDMGKSVETIAILFGCNPQTVKNTLALLDCAAPVRKAVESGAINVTVAQKLSKLTADEQKTKLAEIVESSAGLKGHKKSKAIAKVVSVTEIKMRSKAEVVAMLSRCPTDGAARQIIGWVLGGTDESFANPVSV